LAQIQVEQFDVGGTQGAPASMAAKVSADAGYVAAVIGPYWRESEAFAQTLASAGVPVLDLSPEGKPAGTWRGLVPDQSSQARLLISELERASAHGSLCLGHQTDDYTSGLIDQVSSALAGRVEARFDLASPASITSAVSAIHRAGCGTVGYIGFPTDGTALRDALDAAGLAEVTLVAADPMKTLSYVQSASHDGTLAVCPCADINTSRGAGPQQLVHDFQIDTGWEPGAYAAEGWDAGMMLTSAIRSGATSRAQVANTIGRIESYGGIARRYSFDAEGWAIAAAGLYESRSARWLPVSDTG
jgi:branched-chain amino acid transport system substrate-binding protein